MKGNRFCDGFIYSRNCTIETYILKNCTEAWLKSSEAI